MNAAYIEFLQGKKVGCSGQRDIRVLLTGRAERILTEFGVVRQIIFSFALDRFGVVRHTLKHDKARNAKRAGEWVQQAGPLTE